MGEDAIILISIGGVIVLAILIIVLANWLSARGNQRRASKMMKDMKNDTYEPEKKYMGNQGSWSADDDPYSHNDNQPALIALVIASHTTSPHSHKHLRGNHI